MKVFISYAATDGLALAEQARSIFERAGHTAWMWEHGKTIGALPWEQISTALSEADVVFYVGTPSSLTSYGQRLETGYAMNDRTNVLAVRVDSAPLQSVLRVFTYGTWQQDEFGARCKDLAEDLHDTLEGIRRLEQTGSATLATSDGTQRAEYIASLNARTDELEPHRLAKCREVAIQSYLEDTMVREVAKVAVGRVRSDSDYTTIGSWSFRGLEEFNGTNYYWEPYFTDLARAVAAGEQKFLQEKLRRQIDSDALKISRSEPDFRALQERIEELSGSSLNPNVILAPVELYARFVKFFGSAMDWADNPEQITLGASRLKLYWSHKYAPSACFVVFAANGGTWSVIPDGESGKAITIGIGRSALYPDKVEIGAETTVDYEVTDPEAFCLVELTD